MRGHAALRAPWIWSTNQAATRLTQGVGDDGFIKIDDLRSFCLVSIFSTGQEAGGDISAEEVLVCRDEADEAAAAAGVECSL